MKKTALLAFVFGLVVCGPEKNEEEYEWTIKITDHPDTPTDSSGDKLFKLEVLEREEPVDFFSVMVTLKPAGGGSTSLRFEVSKDDGDGKLGKGDILTCREPATDLVSAGDIGTEYQIGFDMQQEGSKYYQVWTGKWTAQ